MARAAVTTAEDLVTEVGYDSNLRASGLLSVRAGVPVLLVPSTAMAAQLGSFTLRVVAGMPLAMRPVQRPGHAAIIEGAWVGGKKGAVKGGGGGGAKGGGGSAGGCHLEASWGSNPQYAVSVKGEAGAMISLRVVLRRPALEWEAPMADKPVESMMGLYVLSGESLERAACSTAAGRGGEDGVGVGDVAMRKLTLRGKAAAGILHESCFSPTLEVSCTLQLAGGGGPSSLVLVPTTFGAGQAGPFAIELASDGENLAWEQLT